MSEHIDNNLDSQFLHSRENRWEKQGLNKTHFFHVYSKTSFIWKKAEKHSSQMKTTLQRQQQQQQ